MHMEEKVVKIAEGKKRGKNWILQTKKGITGRLLHTLHSRNGEGKKRTAQTFAGKKEGGNDVLSITRKGKKKEKKGWDCRRTKGRKKAGRACKSVLACRTGWLKKKKKGKKKTEKRDQPRDLLTFRLTSRGKKR